MDTKKIDEVRKLRNCAKDVAGFWSRWDGYLADSRCDKKEATFVNPDKRFAAFSFELTFEAHAGYYGNSSCSRVLSVDADLARRYFTRAIQENAKLLFDRAAALMANDAGALVHEAEGEIALLQALLDEAKADAAQAPADPVGIDSKMVETK